MRSGRTNIRDGEMQYVGSNGYNWSRTAAAYTNSTTAMAHEMNFSETDNRPTVDISRWIGLSLRCLAD